MSDLIYRNQAIDAVSRGCKELRGIFADCEKNLNELPSAEPEIVRCEDCKYWNSKQTECEGIGHWFGLVDEWSPNGFCYKGERR